MSFPHIYSICLILNMAKAKKKKREEFIPKLGIDGSFEDLIKVRVTPDPKKEGKPPAKKKTK